MTDALQAICAYFALPLERRPPIAPPAGGTWHLDTAPSDVRTESVAEALAAVYADLVNRRMNRLWIETEDGDADAAFDALLGDVFEACDRYDAASDGAQLRAASQRLQTRIGAPPDVDLGEALRGILVASWHP